MTEWDGLPPSGAGAPSAHLLRHKGTDVERAALWGGHVWIATWGTFQPGHAAMFCEYVGPLLTPAEVRDRELAAFHAGAKSMRTTIETAVRLAALQEEERIYAERPQPHSARDG